jgi:hypothetical protein
MGFHSERGIQNQVATPTTMRFEEGAVRIKSEGTNLDTFFPADCATRVGASVRIHWYPTILLSQALKKSVSLAVAALLDSTVMGSMPFTASHTHPSVAGGALKRTSASMFSPSVLPEPDPESEPFMCATASTAGGW